MVNAATQQLLTTIMLQQQSGEATARPALSHQSFYDTVSPTRLRCWLCKPVAGAASMLGWLDDPQQPYQT